MGRGYFRPDQTLYVHKTADETVNNTTTLQDDDHLFFSVAANDVWIVEAHLLVVGNATADMKVLFTAPAAATVNGAASGARTTDSVMSCNPVSTGASAAIGVAVTTQVAIIEALVVVGATAGVVRLQWAQNTLTVGDTTVSRGSFLRAVRAA